MISEQERAYLKDLAKQQKELADSSLSREQTALWYDHNELKAPRPVISVEEGHYWREIFPELMCTDPLAREMEFQLQNKIQRVKYIGDDRPTPGFYQINFTHCGPLCGLGEQMVRATQNGASDGVHGYHIIPQIEVIEEDFHKLKPTEFTDPWPELLEKKAAVEDVIGQYLPVKFWNAQNSWGPSPMRYVIAFMGMENAYIAMKEEPDWFHRLMEFITEDFIHIYRYQEKNGLLALNNGYDYTGSGNWCFSRELPRKDFTGYVRTVDQWGHLNAEDASGISPADFREFILPYQLRLAREFGLVYYGCCEDVSRFWDDGIDRIPNVRKLSISPWCDEAKMGERLAGTSVIYSRKCRDVRYLGTTRDFDAEGFRANIRETVEKARGCKMEFIFRDIMSLKGNNEKIKEAVRIVREETEEAYCK